VAAAARTRSLGSPVSPSTPEPRPEGGVDDEIGRGEVRRGVGDVELDDPDTPAPQPAAGLPTVVAVVALPLEDHDPTAVGAAHDLDRRPRHGTPGAADEDVDRLGRGGVDGPHLRRGDDRAEPIGGRQPHTEIGRAADRSPGTGNGAGRGRGALRHDHGLGDEVAVGEGDLDPGHPERRGPVGRTAAQDQRGAPGVVAHDLDVVPAGRPDAHPERLERGLLGGEADRIALDGILPPFGVGALGGGEEPVGDAGTALEDGPEALEVHDVDAEADDHDRQRSARSLTGSVMRSTTSTVVSRSSRNTGSVSVTAFLMAAYRLR
jgi:hypothetical protein